MIRRRLGDLTLHPIGLGCLPMSDPRMIGQRERALRTIHAGLDAGVNLLDTANIYAPDGARFGHNEELVAEAVRTYTGANPEIVVATKGGITRAPGDIWGRDGSPDALAAAAEASATRLGVTRIDLYFLHRADPTIHFNEQIQGLRAVQERGIARRIGFSNVTAAQLARALEIAGGPGDGGIVAVQNERSPNYRRDSDVLELCTQHGIAYLPWSPLTGADLFAEQASARHVSPQRLTLAWLLGQSPVVIPIPGSTRPETILDSMAAADLALSGEEVEHLSAKPFPNESLYPDDQPPPAMD